VGITAVVLPRYIAELGDTFARNVGPARAQRLLPLRTIMRHGGRVVLSSDAPVVSYEPLQGLQSALERRTPSDAHLGPTEALTLEQSLDAYTAAPAWLLSMEQELGAIAPGKVADLVLLDGQRQRGRRAVGTDGPPGVPGSPAAPGRQQLVRVLRSYVEHYNQRRPHRSLGHGTPVPSVQDGRASMPAPDRLRRRDILGGPIHEYELTT
jgi:hypothetical protein